MNILKYLYKRKEKKEKDSRSKILEWIEVVVSALVIVIFIRIFLVEAYQIPTGSMEKTLLPGDFLFVNKLIYGPKIPWSSVRLPGFSDVERHDIVVFEYPRDKSLNYVKRCVGLPGDTLTIRGGDVYINGDILSFPSSVTFIENERNQEGDVDRRIFPKNALYNKDYYGPIVIPKKDQVIELTANTYNLYQYLLDYEGKKTSLLGNIVFSDGKPIENYTVKQNYYFMIGDNRDNSEDSRYWGYVPEENIIGAPLVIYWSWNSDTSLLNIINKLASIRWSRIGKLLW